MYMIQGTGEQTLAIELLSITAGTLLAPESLALPTNQEGYRFRNGASKATQLRGCSRVRRLSPDIRSSDGEMRFRKKMGASSEFSSLVVDSHPLATNLQAPKLFATRLTVRGATIAVPKFIKEHRGARANSREDDIVQSGVGCGNYRVDESPAPENTACENSFKV
ncbi:hypothetical protein F4604DRAFT_1675680 [Suillus subluteus]|nr:hypothetical protein F4604DRAFT_1675680 [Suillus subluteus]